MKTIIITIGNQQYIAESLKKANAVIESIHAADLKPIDSRYLKSEKGGYEKIHEWKRNAGDLDFKVEIKTDFEIVEDDDEECPF